MYRCCVSLVVAVVCCCCQSDSILDLSVLRELMNDAKPPGVTLRDINGFYRNRVRENCLFCKCEPSFRYREELLRIMEAYRV